MMMRIINIVALTLLFLVGLQACHGQEMPPIPQEVTLYFGHQGVLDNYNYLGYDDSIHSLSFNQYHWQSPNLGTVKLEHFGATTTIPHVFSLLSVRHTDRTDGVGGMDIQSGLSEAEFVTVEQAYQDYVSLILAFKNAGWQPYFEQDDARIKTEDNLKLLMHGHPLADDKTKEAVALETINHHYVPNGLVAFSFEDWQKVINRNPYFKRFYIKLYLRDVIANIAIEKPPQNPIWRPISLI